MATLAIMKGSSVGERFSLGDVTVIGRYPFCDITLNETNVSRQHARIELEDGRFFIEDLNSQNGTFVNGNRIERRQLLKHNDHINIYQVSLMFVDEEATDFDSPRGKKQTKRETRPKTPAVIESVSATSDSQIIANAEEKWRASVSLLKSLGKTLDVDEMLSHLLDDLFGIFSQADRGYILMVHEGNQLILQALKEDGGTNAEQTLGPIDRTLAEDVIAEGNAKLCLDDDPELSDSVLDLPRRSIMCTPLISPFKKTLGVLYLDTKQDHQRFDSEDLELLVGVAAVAGQSVAFAQQHQATLREHEQHSLELQREIDERKRVEEELRRSNNELQEFAYVASHDLQEPLRAVAGFVEMLALRYGQELDEQALEFIDYAVKGTVSMQSLIDDLLEYSRVRTAGQPFQPTDCNEVFTSAMANLSMSIRESEADIASDTLPTIRADSSQMLQLLQNLIGNAIKYRGEAQPKIRVSASRKENEWVFAIEDNGIGIAKEHSARVFKVFQRLHGRDQYSGSGVGLAICKRICERHDGRIWFESEPLQGSTFFFTMPAANPEDEFDP